MADILIKREVHMTSWLFFCIAICVFGNSFLFGYNIAAVNSPAKLIKAFYAQVYLARDGYETVYNPADRSLYYVEESPSRGLVRQGHTTTAAMATTELLLQPVYGNDTTDLPENFTDIGTRSTALPDTTTVTFGNETTDAYDVSNTSISARHPHIARTPADIDADNFIEGMWSATVAIFVFFGMIGAFSSAKIAENIGRKNGMVVVSVLMFFAAFFGGITVEAMSPECLLASRVFTGLHNGISVSLTSLYLAEISPRKIRGSVVTCHQLFITIGIMFSMVMGLPELAGTWEYWPIIFAFNGFPALVCLLIMPFCPESPRYLLIKKGDDKAAREALIKLRGSTDVEDEMDEMKTEIKKHSTVATVSMFSLVTKKEFRRPLIIAVMMQLAQQWSGINAAMSYSSFVFEQAKVPLESIPYVVVGQGALGAVATLIAVPLMDKLGRRMLLIWPMCVMVLSFGVLTVSLLMMSSGVDDGTTTKLAMVSIGAMFTYVVGFAVGLGPIPFIVVSEIFRQGPRAAAMSFSLAINWVSNFILMLSFRFLQKYVGAYTYVIFMVVLVVCIVFISVSVPETKNRTFHEIAQSIAAGNVRRRGRYAIHRSIHGNHQPATESTTGSKANDGFNLDNL